MLEQCKYFNKKCCTHVCAFFVEFQWCMTLFYLGGGKYLTLLKRMDMSGGEEKNFTNFL